MRSDLSPEQQLVQAVHAAYESGIRFGSPKIIHSVVVCSVKDINALLSNAAKLCALGIKHYIFKEPDIENDPTALATEPVGKEGRRIFKNLKLWRSKK